MRSIKRWAKVSAVLAAAALALSACGGGSADKTAGGSTGTKASGELKVLPLMTPLTGIPRTRHQLWRWALTYR